jgi:glycosyltransferase involved in cell wall biosynthesis
MFVNSVYSSDVMSVIFDAIQHYFCEYSGEDVLFRASARPLDGADVYHYHRVFEESTVRHPSIATVHHDLGYSTIAHTMESYIENYRKVDFVVCLNTTQQKILNENGINCTCVIPHGVNEKLFHRKKRRVVKDGAYRLGILSKRYGNSVKGEKWLLEVFEWLPKDSFRLVLVGQTRSRDAAAFERCQVECEIYDHLPYRLYPALYDSLDFLGIASVLEGGPANVPEAIATGTPILSRKVGFVPDLIHDGETGLLLPHEPADAARMLQEVCENKGGICERLFEGAYNQPPPPTWREIVGFYKTVLQAVQRNDLSTISGRVFGKADVQ